MAQAQAGKPCDVPIIDALEFRRDQYMLPRTEFAALLGMSLSHYGEVLNGKRKLPKRAMIRAYAIGVPADVLLQADTHDQDHSRATARIQAAPEGSRAQGASQLLVPPRG